MMPPISHYMTRSPHAVAPRDKVSSARHIMHEYAIHHLPVLDGRKLVGILSEHDLVAARFSGEHVCDAMSEAVEVSEDTPLDEVITLMEAKRLGSVVIVGPPGVRGIFTLADAMRAFRDVLGRARGGER